MRSPVISAQIILGVFKDELIAESYVVQSNETTVGLTMRKNSGCRYASVPPAPIRRSCNKSCNKSSNVEHGVRLLAYRGWRCLDLPNPVCACLQAVLRRSCNLSSAHIVVGYSSCSTLFFTNGCDRSPLAETNQGSPQVLSGVEADTRAADNSMPVKW